jgi:hypothetical protein
MKGLRILAYGNLNSDIISASVEVLMPRCPGGKPV